jgi:hypothetical protein
MSETKRIRYKTVGEEGKTGPAGEVVHNQFGVWTPGDADDVPAAIADRMVADGCFELAPEAETRTAKAKRLADEAAAKEAEAAAKEAAEKKAAEDAAAKKAKKSTTPES